MRKQRMDAVGLGWKIAGLFILGLYSAHSSESGPPAALHALLESLPGKRITLSEVLSRARNQTDSYQVIMAQKQAWGVPSLLAQAQLDPEFHAQWNWTDNRNQPTTPFSTSRTLAWSGSLGVSTQLRTGTRLKADLVQGHTALTFPNPGFAVAPYYETQVQLGVGQSLWSDFLGRSTRLALEEGELQTQVQRWALQESLQSWTLGIVELYYGAWFAQHQAELAAASTERSARLMNVTEAKLRRGTAEQPDFLQAQSVWLQARSAEAKTSQELGKTWRTLVLQLKFDPAWMNLDPRFIPIALDEGGGAQDAVVSDALQKCGTNPLQSMPLRNVSTERASLSAAAAVVKKKRLEQQTGFDVVLQGGLVSNGVASTIGTPWSNAFRVQTPAWQVGVQMTLPLGTSRAEADLRAARADLIRIEAESSSIRSTLQDAWLSQCSALLQHQESIRFISEALAIQHRRAVLEEERFNLGRSTVQQVVRAQEESAQADTQHAALAVDQRRLAWKILQLKENSLREP